jgi:DNA polymerase-3 subunit alpha (Gram-positive type)
MLMVINEVFERGLEFAPIDINRSEGDAFTVFTDGDTKKIRLPLCSAPGVSVTAGRKIADYVRSVPQLTSIEDLARDTGSNKTVIESLKVMGAFGDLPQSNQMTLF